MFAAALLGAPDAAGKASADAKLRDAAPGLAKRLDRANRGTRGLLRVQVNGTPDSLIRQLMLALARAAEQAALPQPLVKRIQAAARPGTRMDHVIDLIIQNPHVYAGPLHLALLAASSRHAQRHPSRRSVMSARSH